MDSTNNQETYSKTTYLNPATPTSSNNHVCSSCPQKYFHFDFTELKFGFGIGIAGVKMFEPQGITAADNNFALIRHLYSSLPLKV